MSAPPMPPAATESWPRLIGRQVRASVLLCFGLAVVLTVVMSSSLPLWKTFTLNWIYSQCIGGTIQLLIETARRTLAGALRRGRPDDPALARGWPGWARFLPLLVVASVVGYLLGGLLADTLTGGRHIASIVGGGQRQPILFLGTMTLLISVGTTYTFYLASLREAAEARAQATERAAAEHQLKLLESQLEPHMLFNTLANLRVLIAVDPPRATAMLDHLIAYLRATLGGSRAPWHPLATEFDRLADYLALMQVRMGGRLQVAFDLPDALRAVPVPPLLLQPLVENAIRHGLEPKPEGGGITVQALREADRLVLRVVDAGVGLASNPSTAGTGFGTEQVRLRLRTVYGSAARMTLAPAPDGVGTEARVELPAAPPVPVPGPAPATATPAGPTAA